MSNHRFSIRLPGVRRARLISGAVAALLMVSFVTAEVVELASSPPAGYFAIEIDGSSDNHVSLPLFRAATTHAKVSSAQPDRILCAGGDLIPNRFSATTGPSGNLQDGYQLEFISGNLKGVAYRILGNSDEAILVDTQGDDLTSHPLGTIAYGDTIRIRPAWTISSVFGGNDDEVVLEKKTSPSDLGDSVLLYDQATIGTNKAPGRELSYIVGEGWRALGEDPVEMAGQPLPFGEPFVVRRHSPASLSLIVVGDPLRESSVQFVQGASATSANDVYVSWVHTESVPLMDSGLVNAAAPDQSVLLASPGILFRTDTLLAWSDGPTGFNRAPDRVYYHVAGEGWRQAGSATTTTGSDEVLEPGRAYIIRKAAGSEGKDWVQPISAAE